MVLWWVVVTPSLAEWSRVLIVNVLCNMNLALFVTALLSLSTMWS
jgi:hypothetical protein